MTDWTIGNDAATVARQYGTTERLQTRSTFWDPSAKGDSPQDVALEALRSHGSRAILEIGCGQGEFADRMRRDLGAQVLATDQSPAMVEAAAARGLACSVVDADELPFADACFDAVVAMWMLYHVSDLDRALSEARRVIKPGGVLVAVTNGRAHTADLRAMVGLAPAKTQFMTETGEDVLRRHFTHVDKTVTSGKATADHATARAYLATFAPDLADRLPAYEGTRTFTGSNVVFVAS